MENNGQPVQTYSKLPSDHWLLPFSKALFFVLALTVLLLLASAIVLPAYGQTANLTHNPAGTGNTTSRCLPARSGSRSISP